MKITVAIDPGASGGIAVDYWGRVVTFAMPENEGSLCDLLREILGAAEAEGVPMTVFLEQVGGYHKGRGGQPGSAMFNFGAGWGFIKGAVAMMRRFTGRARLVLVRPQQWQPMFNLGKASACASSSEWKNKLKAEAQRRFPHLTVTLSVADALLILEWARVHGGE